MCDSRASQSEERKSKGVPCGGPGPRGGGPLHGQARWEQAAQKETTPCTLAEGESESRTA